MNALHVPDVAAVLGSRTAVALTKSRAPGRMKRLRSMRLRFARSSLPHTRARVAELADALRSGRSDRKVVEVRVLSRAPILEKPVALVRANEISPGASTGEALPSCRSSGGTNDRAPN